MKEENLRFSGFSNFFGAIREFFRKRRKFDESERGDRNDHSLWDQSLKEQLRNFQTKIVKKIETIDRVIK